MAWVTIMLWLLQHGWGFDSSFWDLWKKMLLEHGEQVVALERGYFGKPKVDYAKCQIGNRVFISHS